MPPWRPHGRASSNDDAGRLHIAWHVAVGWYPFQYLPRISGVIRELRASLDDGHLFMAEAQLSDPVGQLVGGSGTVLFFLLSDKLRYRAAPRSKQSAVRELASGHEPTACGDDPPRPPWASPLSRYGLDQLIPEASPSGSRRQRVALLR